MSMAAPFSRLVRTVPWIYALQLGAAAVFVPLHTEKYFDLFGSLGFMTTGFLSLYQPWLTERVRGNKIPFPPLSSHAPRQLLMTACLGLWAGRLGYFLFQRVLSQGKDSRFDEIKYQPAKFTAFWAGQATWNTVVGLPVLLANALPAATQRPLGPIDFIGLGVFASSLAFEAIADRQKSQWRQEKTEKKHEEKFITRGLWSISRHPNYVGEVGIQTGMWIMSLGAVLGSKAFPMGTALAAGLSPLFTYFLLTKASGVPPLEESAEKKWGDDPKWQEYKRTTPVFFPWVKA